MNCKMSRRQRRQRLLPTLRFSPYAWAKLLFLRDRGPTEVGGFGIASTDDPLFLEDVCLVRQCATELTVRFEDTAVADFFDDQVDRGLKPDRFGRLWLHTHPGHSAQPSHVDEETFSRCFGRTDWAVMFILAKHGQTYARLQYNLGPHAGLELPVATDYRQPFPASNQECWDEEYRRCVTTPPVIFPQTSDLPALQVHGLLDFGFPDERMPVRDTIETAMRRKEAFNG